MRKPSVARNDRGGSEPTPPGPVLLALLGLPIWVYRLRLGRLLGHRFLLLRHRGRRTGVVHAVVLEAVRYDATLRETIVVAGWGERTQWLRNLEAGGAVAVTTGSDTYRPLLRLLEPVESAMVLAGYEASNRLIAPLVRRVLSALLGWPYGGTDDDRRRAARELVLVGLRPAPSS